MPKTHYPRPQKRYYRRTWEIYWNWNNRRYIVYPGYDGEADDMLAEADLRQIAAALAMPLPAFPNKYAAAPAVVRYLEERYGQTAAERVTHDFDSLCVEYLRQSKLVFSRGWYVAVSGHLRELRKVGGYDRIATGEARKFLASILDKGNSPGTYNRALMACRGFYKWLVEGGFIEANPFAGVKQLKEARGEADIVYCTKQERGRIVAAAYASGLPCAVAIPIAFFTGMRREEIARMRHEDIFHPANQPGAGRISVPKTKTKKRRTLPLAKELTAFLPEEGGKGFIVDYPREHETAWASAADDLIEAIRCRLCRPAKCNPDGTPAGARGKKTFVITENDLTEPAPEHCSKTAADGLPWIPAERIGWNVFRHTFCSLKAQDGVPLDKITSWTGNTPEVSRRHYSQFEPRDRHDDDIDKG